MLEKQTKKYLDFWQNRKNVFEVINDSPTIFKKSSLVKNDDYRKENIVSLIIGATGAGLIMTFSNTNIVLGFLGVMTAMGLYCKNFFNHQKKQLKQKEDKNKLLLNFKNEILEKIHAQALFSFLFHYVENHEPKYLEELKSVIYKLDKNNISSYELLDFIKLNQKIVTTMESQYYAQDVENTINNFMVKNEIAKDLMELQQLNSKEKYLELL